MIKEPKNFEDILFFIAQLINYKIKNNSLISLININKEFERKKRKDFTVNCNDFIQIICGVYEDSSIIYYYIIIMTNYGYTIDDVIKCYWKKWQKNMQRIGKEWN